MGCKINVKINIYIIFNIKSIRCVTIINLALIFTFSSLDWQGTIPFPPFSIRLKKKKSKSKINTAPDKKPTDTGMNAYLPYSFCI